jgi:hypothetical protein
MLCIIAEIASKWTTVIQGKVIGTSKHKDYSLFHFKAKDVASLKLPLTKFIFVDSKAEVDEVILADQLTSRGVNYKTAKRDDADLTEEEQAEVDAAFKLAMAHTMRVVLHVGEEIKAEPPAADQPKIAITPEVVAIGLTAVDQARRDAHAAISAATTGEELIAAVDQLVATNTPEEEAEAEADRADDEPEPEDQPDPLSTVKPSRKKKRR